MKFAAPGVPPLSTILHRRGFSVLWRSEYSYIGTSGWYGVVVVVELVVSVVVEDDVELDEVEDEDVVVLELEDVVVVVVVVVATSERVEET